MMRICAARLLGLLAIGGLAAAGVASCDSSSGSHTAKCSSCQTAYTLEQCERWGAKAGCKSSTVSQEGTCTAGIAGCAFKECKGGPICDDSGNAFCATCSRDLTQGDCDNFSAAAGCSSAETTKAEACGHAAVACSFEGCGFEPTCD
jgi:hypothetical protein